MATGQEYFSGEIIPEEKYIAPGKCSGGAMRTLMHLY